MSSRFDPVTVELGDAFWKVFAREHWERRPGVFRGLFAGVSPLLSSSQAFAGVMKACDLSRAGEPAFIRLFIGNALVQSRLAKYLPTPEDVTFDAFARRVAPALFGQGFGLTVNGFAHHDFDLFTRVRRFLRGLYAQVGMPGDVTDLDVFIGNYRQTPFGIHTDTSSNFCVVFEGKKRFLVWPGPTLAHRSDMHHSVDFDEVREQATILEGTAGDVVYWPSSYWHVAESDGELSGVMNISLYLGDHAKPFVDAAPTAAAPTARQERAPLTTLPWEPAAMRLPEILEEAVARAPNEPTTKHDALRAWVARTTAYNIYRTMPKPLPMNPLTPNGRVEVDTEFPIVAVENDGVLILSTHGHVIEVPAVAKVRAMIATLNAGGTHDAEALITQASGPAMIGGARMDVAPDDVRTVLENLLAIRAIREVL